MFSKKEIQQSLLGSLEIFLLMPKGIDRFQRDTSSMIRSFLIPLVLMPLTFISLYYMHAATPQISFLPYSTAAFMFFVKGIVAVFLIVGIIYFFAKTYNRLDYFCLTITACNWMTIISTVIFLPALCMMIAGWHNWDDIYPLSLMLTLYSYVVVAFLLTFGLRIPWEMAGFLSIVTMAINQTGIDFIFWLAQSS